MSSLPEPRPHPVPDDLFGGPAPTAARPATAGTAPEGWLDGPATARDAAPTYCAWPQELLLRP